MARHVRSPGSRLGRLGTVFVLWAAGLAVGFYAVLSAGAKFGCAHSAHGLACKPAGSALGGGLVLVVIVVVAVITVLVQDAVSLRGRMLRVLVGLVLLGACLLAARALLGTV